LVDAGVLIPMESEKIEKTEDAVVDSKKKNKKQ